MRKIKDLPKYEKVAIIAFTFILFVLIALGVISKINRQPDWIVYSKNLDEVAVSVNDKDITLREAAFYVAYDEAVVEEQAQIYDPSDTLKYWNVLTNGVFIRLLAKEATMDKIIHDEIFYQMAVRNNITLSEEELDEVESSKLKFWNNVMFGDKLEMLGVSEDDLNKTIEKIALAQKYQIMYAASLGLTMDDYNIGNPFYEKLLAENEYKIVENVWNRVEYGEVTLHH